MPDDIRTNPAAFRRGTLAGPAVAVAALVCALIACAAAGVGLRDPDGVASSRLLVAFGIVALLIGVDAWVRAGRGLGTRRPPLAAVGEALRERWSKRRVIAVVLALLSFFASYLAYRNIKSVAPLLRPGDLFDRQLLNMDRDLFGGTDPAQLLHDVLGTGVAAHGMSYVYTLFFLFIPVSLAVSLVFASDVRIGLFFTCALSLNWLIGAGSYLLLPSLGPFQADPNTFATLPATTVTDLQTWLLEQRHDFLANPDLPGSAQSIGAFASLHMSIWSTGAITAHLLGLPRKITAALWVLTGLTAMATIYWGWHYLLDDVGGIVIAVAALALARVLTGIDLRTARERRRTPASSSPAAAEPEMAA
jgi:hypothetical protein